MKPLNNFISGIASLLLAGFFSATKDGVSTHYVFLKSKFPRINDYYFNPNLSWLNKWAAADKIGVERFYQSSRLLVALTDWWHMAGFIYVTLIALSIAFFINSDFYTKGVFKFIIAACMFKVFFNLGYFLGWELLFN